KDGNVIDRFGQLGFDPGSQWSSGGVSTAEQTLVRKESVTKGDPNATDPFDPSVEWDGYGRDDASFLGAHTSACDQSGPGGEDCMDLFLSEYIEGSGNNKCIELYNPTGAAINLSDYVLNISRNGGTQTADITFSGTIPAFGTYVVCNSSADMAFLDRADQTDNNINHNGDDAYTLLKDGVVIDRFGQLGFDPGSQWSAGGVSTAEQTLVRKESVAKGDPNAGDPFDPSVEWDSYGRDDASFLGFHISDCVDVAECLITGVMINPITGCRDNGSDSQGDDFYLAEVTVAVTNPPATGDLELYGPNGFITEIAAGSITGGMAVFSNVELPANALPVMVTASFSSTDCSGDGMAPPVYPCSLPDCTPVINELDYDNPGTDDREFVELYNPCSQAVNLADYSVIFVNGNNGEIYGDFQLPSVMLGPGEFFVICGDGANTPNCDLDVSPNTNLIQNGDPDAVALLYIQAIADAVSYEGNTTGFTEGSGEGLFDPGAPQLGIGRYVDGVDTDQNNADFSIQCITPGEPNTNVSQYCSIPDGITVAPISCTGFNDAEYDADTDTYTLTSACAHYFGAQDQELLVGADACGFNTEVSARITGVNPTFGYAGVTMRESNAPGARKMSIIRYANGRKIVEYRPSPNAPFYQYWLPAYTIYADYVRISRWGDYFFAAVSFDGVYWTTIYQQYMGGMPNCVLAGMTVSSYANGATTEASFTNFNITGSAIPPRPLAPGAINPEEAVSSLNVFPNPVVDELSVTIGNAPAEEATISILALDGRELYRGVHNINGNTVNLQLAPLQMTPGMYILTANTGEEVLTKRFVKADQ
ncbi:MAG: lamin tail domain-containing protein, partial [Phaeodactylibacter sp.]|nr:lamin tail domain-containing protein [Phaeodactylibacter sp.]